MSKKDSLFALLRFAGASRRASQVHLAKEPGQPAGTLVHLGEQRTESVSLRLYDYDPGSAKKSKPSSVEELPARSGAPSQVRWLHVSGLHDVDTIAAIGERFQVPPLVLEDILNTGCRPKVEEFEGGLFVVVRLLTCETDSRKIDLQQFAVVLLEDDTLLSFSEVDTTAFDPVLKRIRTGGGGRIRNHGGDYLLWALLDVVVDHYLRVAHQMDETLVDIDEQLQADFTEVSAADISRSKREATELYRHIRPCREIAGVLNRADSALIDDRTQPFLRDLNDHAMQVVETAEYLRESASSLRDFYQTVMSNRMNEVMKVLTCFATIFLPLTFLAGIYGMNFEHMPELSWPLAYGVLWMVFVLTAAGMFWFFRKKRWL